MVPFIRTGYIRYVVMAMNHRRYIAWFHSAARVVSATPPGTAHRPFPTVSLVGGFFHPHRLYSERGGRQIADEIIV